MKPIPWSELRNDLNPSALFLDRDGVLIRWKEGYRSDPDEIEFIQEAIEKVRDIRARFDYMFLVTNQSGIDKGLVTWEQVQAVNYRIEEYLQLKFTKIYICPHLPDTCECRKPKPGMFLQAIKKFRLYPEKCLMIGDAESDIIAANSAGIPGILVNRY